MKFTKLRLVGFKSFVEPSEFVIERGLTGVVGPNGCGKSNLVEALRWVMGENSYKNMRASGMDDVIFSGSGNRPARNTAEVALFLDNTDRSAPPSFNDADELQVSRRIEREAGSVYRINGKEARARDVQLLFADQSTGARSPSMVGQGRIGELIQAKPQARRALLEEAAGISGLHSRRHEAEMRMRAAEQNLERLDDVVGELATQIESLKRQARQASRFRSLSEDIRRAEAILLHLAWTQAKTQEGESKSALAQATNQVAERASQQMEAAKAQAIGSHKLPNLRNAKAEAAAALQRLTIAHTQIQEEAKRIRERTADLQKRIAQLDADIAREQQLARDNTETLQRLDEEEAQLRELEENAVEGEEEALALLETMTAELEEREQLLSTLTAEKAEAGAARAQAERALRERSERCERLNQQLASINRELAEVVARISALPDPAAKQEELDVAVEAMEMAEEAVADAEEAVSSARAAEADARAPLSEARAEVQRIETEAATLAKILSAGVNAEFPAVLEQIRVERGFETALGAALGEDLDVPTDAAAPVHWGTVSAHDDEPVLPEGVRSLASVASAPQQLARRLAQIGIVEPADGERLQPLLKPGQRLVSRDGALWRWDGYRASADAPTAAAMRLAQKNRLAELEAEAVEARDRLEEAAATLAQAENAVREQVERERQAREAVREAQRRVSVARDALAAAERASGELSSRRAVLEASQTRLAEEHEEALEAVEEARASLEDAPDLSELQAKLDRAAAEVATARGKLAEMRAAYEGRKREAEARVRRLAAIVQERQSWVFRRQNADNQITSLSDRREEIIEELERLAEAPDDLDHRVRALISEIATAEARAKEASDILQEAESAQSELDKRATESIQALSSAREARARAEERQAAAEERRIEVEARIQQSMNIAPHLVAQHTGLKPDEKLPEMNEVERRLERLKAERERLGAVNLRAEEEQRELSERYDLIVSEREDVIEAIRKLRQAIQSLNKEGRERLLAAFEQVNGHFQRLFTHLFGGGTAELQLVESDDPLDAGLEILARPPGKKPQTMTLLSGGEQALTAMALIFAVFLTNPAPICVLDEVDAPLDDHNVERFCNLLDEMARSTDTRFVVITHNPITMARMNRLFGVTMAEQGVSQLVSVDLQLAEQLAEAS
ncbi:chromosome segregation protein SMC [Nitratireductor aestuarii]|nr:chromosome segregation protein SMC [Nitratireductor aestuarii]